MDIISFNEAATANSRIEICNANPDSTSGIITVPKVIESGETVTIPAGRVAILPNVQVDGDLVIDGEVFIPSGATLSSVVEKVTSTDNAIVRFDGITGAVQNSSVIIDDAGNVGVGLPIPISKFHVQGNIRTACPSGDAVNTRGIIFDIDGSIHGRLAVDNTDNLLFFGGALGYGTGSGGTVTQLTSKSTAVTLNKPTGKITMSNAALAAGANVVFTLNNSVLTYNDTIEITLDGYSVGAEKYIIRKSVVSGAAYINIKNDTATSYSDVIVLNFTVIKGAIS